MGDSPLVLADALSFPEIVAYHDETTASLRSFFRSMSSDFTIRFAEWKSAEIEERLQSRLEETELRSILVLLTSLEATLRIDFDVRCQRRLKDDLSRYFREVRRSRPDRVRLDEDILEGWRLHSDARGSLLSELRAAFRLRHWLAHGRYWLPKLGRRYDFDGLSILTEAILVNFPFVS